MADAPKKEDAKAPKAPAVEGEATAVPADGGKKKKMMIMIGGAAVLVLGGAGAFFMMSGGSKPKEGSGEPAAEHGAEPAKAEGQGEAPKAEAPAPAEPAKEGKGAEKKAENEKPAASSAKEEKGKGEAAKEGAPAAAEGKSAEGGPTFGETYTFKPFHLNLGNPLENHFVRLEVAVEYSGEGQKQEMEKRLPQLRDAIVSVASRKSREFLLGPDGKDQLRREILIRINRYMTKPVDSVYITDILIE